MTKKTKKLTSMPPSVLILLVTCAFVQSFTPARTVQHGTALFGKKRKFSMKERRKQRAKRQPAVQVDPRLQNVLGPAGVWEKEESPVTTAPDEQRKGDDDVDVESEETTAKASSLIQSQRKSVDALTFIRKRIEERFPAAKAAKSLSEHGYFLHDNFLSSDDDEPFGDDLLSEMFGEGTNMFRNDLLDRDLTRLGDGEFVGSIIGGEKYTDCPRLTEYVVR